MYSESSQNLIILFKGQLLKHRNTTNRFCLINVCIKVTGNTKSLDLKSLCLNDSQSPNKTIFVKIKIKCLHIGCLRFIPQNCDLDFRGSMRLTSKTSSFFLLTRLYEVVLNKFATRVCYHCATSSLALFSTHNVADKTEITRLYELVLNKPAIRVCYHCATSSLTLFSTNNVADRTEITISYFTKSIFDNYDLFDIEN